MAMQDEDLRAATATLVKALREEKSITREGKTLRTTPAWVVETHAVLPPDLHEIATATHRYLHMAERAQHPLYKWTVTYQPDGAHFLAIAPS